MMGIVSYFNEERGFGFVSTANGRYFFHVSQFSGRPVKYARVQFDLAPGLPGKAVQATNVRFVNPNGVESDVQASDLVTQLANLLGGAR